MVKYFLIFILALVACKQRPVLQPNSVAKMAILEVDEAPHFKNQLEWWYLTGHLFDSLNNKEYGIEYVFFHFNPLKASDYLMVNVAISDPQGKKFYYDYKASKIKNKLTAELPLNFNLKNGNETWTLKGSLGNYEFKANMLSQPGFGMDLKTKPIKEVLMHAGTGYENYGNYAQAGYYSYPRLAASGQLTIDGKPVNVKGELWYDRQWDCSGVMRTDIAWDWFSIQSNEKKEEIMLYKLYKKDSSLAIHGGTIYKENGQSIDLKSTQLNLKVLETWTSAVSGKKYPVKWSVQIPEHGYDFEISVRFPNQELRLSFPFRKIEYWDGMCEVKGTCNGQSFTGKSYVELTNR